MKRDLQIGDSLRTNDVPEALEKAGGDPSGWKTPKWTVEGDQEFNSKERIVFSFLSLIAPGASVFPLDQQPSFCR